MPTLFPKDLKNRIAAARIITGFSAQTPNDAVMAAKALRTGGIDTLEVTLRTRDAVAGIQAIAQELPDVLLGVGTILTPEQVRDVKEAGAHFGVSPGISRTAIDAARDSELPFAPGIATPSDLTLAAELGCRVVKFFPAEAMGGVHYLRNLAAPFASHGIQYVPFGGLNMDNFSIYLKEPMIIAVGGTWIAPQTLIARQDWDGITELAREARRISEETL